ncbi:helix-turn-helix domain-containing protein [Flavobacterium algicola]|uniref:helix-turn-helix domain-containing protein n=1 Tax=Flavobacterium algicola TaxID=556529 RepID=UPI001EFE0FD5|nr:helix-turn-helix domain-containing protein [Flavobacterium algicola]MCG9792221.1 helix-turn-helix domain-containing protein [Flavobacterium algicola]
MEVCKSWNDKFQLLENVSITSPILSDDSIGIFILYNADTKIVFHLKPLNENFGAIANDNHEGDLINFRRDLIDEDDIEYALDIMSLFNKNSKITIGDFTEIIQIMQVLHLLKTEFSSSNASYIMIKTLLKVLLLHLIRVQNEVFLKQDLNQKRIFQFLELMETNFINETSANFYASIIGISVKRLNQILQEKLKLTAKQIIQQRQITEAKRQLVKSEISTKELAFKLGFDSNSSFSRFFKKNVGVTPSDFRL